MPETWVRQSSAPRPVVEPVAAADDTSGPAARSVQRHAAPLRRLTVERMAGEEMDARPVGRHRSG
jgi:hypothetical protein